MGPGRPRVEPPSNIGVSGPTGRAESDRPPDEFAQAVQDVLTHLYDPAYVQTHPLAPLACRSSEATSKSAGQILRRDVIAAIESLRASSEDANAKGGRGFEILSCRYINGLSIKEVRDRLAISRSTYHRECLRGVRAIVSVLRTQWGLVDGLPVDPGGSIRLAPARELDRTVRTRAGLPEPLTSLVGRESDLISVIALLSTSRLLTLTGSGGCGKTRLALAVVKAAARDFADTVILIELASLTDPEQVPHAIALSFGHRDRKNRVIVETLVDYLRDRRTLLVLDNCEHVIDACASVAATLLGECHGLTILATSRQALRTSGEVMWRVPSLAAPNPVTLAGPGTDPEAILRQYSAVRLFVERAAAVRSGFQLTPRNVSAVAQVCWSLDGIPLAIELAAAQMNALSVDDLAAHLSDRFGLLTSGDRTALPRHRTLRGAIDWSYGLLRPDERELFARVGVFAGGFTVNAAEAICAGEGLETKAVLPLLARLVDKSLVAMAEDSDAGRYFLFDTLRHYAQERLAESSLLPKLGYRQACFFAEWAEQMERIWRGPDPSLGYRRFERERENLRVALSWPIRSGNAPLALRLAAASATFWLVQGPLGEAAERLRCALNLPGASERTAARAKALNRLGGVARELGDDEAASGCFEESLSIYRELGDLYHVGNLLGDIGDLEFDAGRLDSARSLIEESLQIIRELDDWFNVGWRLARLGWVRLFLGDTLEARTLFEDSTRIAKAAGGGTVLPFATRGLGCVALQLGHVGDAQALLLEAQNIGEEFDSVGLLLLGIEDLAVIAAVQGQAARAVRLAAAAEARRGSTGIKLARVWRDWYDVYVAPARQTLSDQELASASAEGGDMTLEEAMTYAREIGAT